MAVIVRVKLFVVTATWVAWVAACGSATPPSVAPLPAGSATVGTSSPSTAVPSSGEADFPQGPIPVTSADPSWGNRDALVTVVWFGDLQCPFTARVNPTITELESHYRPDQMRVVWKNYPLPFHQEALPLATHAMAVFAAGGEPAFWKFLGKVWAASDSELSSPSYASWASDVGVSRTSLEAAFAGATAKVSGDLALAHQLGVSGTPHFLINGTALSGAQALPKFVAVIDAELTRAEQSLAAGTKRGALYGVLSQAAFANQAPVEQKAEVDDTTYLVPVGTSPVRGKSTALVTIVEFSDFQCPFCKRVEPQLDEVMRRYGDDVRLVWKHRPLPFHARAEPAAELSLEARAEKGDEAFFRVHDALYESQSQLEDADLLNIAKAQNLDLGKVRKALASKRYAKTIDADVALAEDVGADGTPHFFINGRRLVGAQPLENFTRLIDEELVKARALVARGTSPSGVYAELQKSAKAADPPEQKTVPPAGADQPFLGKRDAKVTLVEFADFQCPFCGRADQTVQSLLALYPNKLKVVWRHLPLPFHAHARDAAEAAVEAFRQKGNAGFWGYRTLLFKNQGQDGGLEREALLRYAGQMGLDTARFAVALDDHRGAKVVDADAAIAEAAGINGTPAFVINGVFLSGAQPLEQFRRIIDRALAAP